MNRKQMEEIARKRAPKRPRHLSAPDNEGTTGQDALMLILGGRKPEDKPEPEKQPVILYLREGVNPADRNFTKYPNDIHTVMLQYLRKEYEGILYVYLWRRSFGYGRNYCRTSYLEISKNTLISSRKTAQRAVSNLVEKHFVVRARQEDGSPNVNQQGALYRVFTPKEIQNRTTEEGVSFDDLPLDGMVCQAIPSEATPRKANNNGTILYCSNTESGMASQTTGHTDHTLTDHTGIVPQVLPSLTIPEANPDKNKAASRCGHADHTFTGHPLKDNNENPV